MTAGQARSRSECVYVCEFERVRPIPGKEAGFLFAGRETVEKSGEGRTVAEIEGWDFFLWGAGEGSSEGGYGRLRGWG